MIVNWRCLLHDCPIACCLRSLSCPPYHFQPYSALLWIMVTFHENAGSWSAADVCMVSNCDAAGLEGGEESP